MSTTLPRIAPATLDFLNDLERHNHRDWFLKHKERYQAAHANVAGFVEVLLERMRNHDKLSTTTRKEAMYRIYNDTRFHTDKPPYKTWFGGSIGRVKPALRGGYHFRIKPGGSFVACGFFAPEPADLKRIRVDIDQDLETWRKLLKGKQLRDTFGEIQGEGVKTAPKGYSKDHPGIDLLRRNQYLFRHPFNDREVLAADFVEQVDAAYRSVRPFFDHMSEVLTTDKNGVSLLRMK